jgi:hypothetical protein
MLEGCAPSALYVASHPGLGRALVMLVGDVE